MPNMPGPLAKGGTGMARERSDASHYLLVLGYSLEMDGSLHPALEARLLTALEMYQPGTKLILSGKMPPKFLRPDRCSATTEAAAMRAFLSERGVEDSDLLLEEQSVTTLTNIFYTRRLILDPQNIRQIAVVSNEFHLPLVDFCCRQVLADHIEWRLVESPNKGFTPNELELWYHVIRKMTLQIYPRVFKDVPPGDMESLSEAIAESTGQDPGPVRLDFEHRMRDLLRLSHDTPLFGIL